MLRISSAGITLPVGLFGELRIRSFVLSVIAFLTCSAVRTKSVSSVSMNTLFAPQNVAIAGNVTQYGFGISTSSPGFKTQHAALKSPCLPPQDAAISEDVMFASKRFP